MDDLNKNIKNAAERFTLSPSPRVWANVALAIKKRKKKRFLFLFIFLTGCTAICLGTANFLLRNKETDNTIISKKTTRTIPTPSNVTNYNNNKPTKQENKSQQENNNNIPIVKHLPATSTITRNSHNLHTANNTRRQDDTAISSIASVPINPLTTKPNSSPAINIITLKQNVITPDATGNTATSTWIKNEAQGIEKINTNSTHSLLTTADKPNISLQSNPPDVIYKSEPITDSTAITQKTNSEADTVTMPGTGKQKNKWGLIISSGICINNTRLEEDGDYQFISNYRNNTDKKLTTINYNIAVSYRIRGSIELFAGIGMNTMGEIIKNQQRVYRYDTIYNTTSVPTKQIILSKGNTNINGDSTGTNRNKYRYLEFLFGIRYPIFEGERFVCFLQPEFSLNKLTQGEGYYYDYTKMDYVSINDNLLRPWVMAIGGSITLQYRINKNIAVEVAPHYSYFLQSVYNSSYPIHQKFQQSSLRFSLHYLF